MNLFLTMVGAMYRILKDIATSKTQRYFLANIERELEKVGDQKSDEAKQYPKLICDVVRTFCAVMSKRAKSSMIEADGERYPVSDYTFPTAWWQLALARVVYATRGAIEFADPYFKAESVPGRLLSPSQVARFFEMYNSTQNGSEPISMAGVPESFNNFAYLGQFKALVSGDGMADWNAEGGVFDDIVAQLLEIEAPVDSRFVKTWEKYDERSVDKWLMSVK